MFVVLEGVDGAGKSSLAQEVADLLPGKTDILHFGQLKTDPIFTYAVPFEDYVPGEDRNVICDRLHWGELIYGPLYRGQSLLTEPAFRWIELYLASLGAVAFNVTQTSEVLRARFAQRGEDFLQDAHIEPVIEQFAAISTRSVLNVSDVSPGFEHDLARRVVDMAAYRDQQSAQVFSRWPTYIGRSMVRTLLVGDTRGGKPPHDTRTPFMAKASGSGAFLLGAFDPTWWTGLGMVNSADVPNVGELFEQLGEPNVVALGRNAHDELKRQGVEHAAVPHPQYIRRFHNAKQRAYGALIETVDRTGEQRLSWPN